MTPILLLAATLAVSAPPPPRPTPPGAVCGDPALVGVPLAPVVDDACGIPEPVSLASVHGVALEPPATLDCATAHALAVWLRVGPDASFTALGRELRALTVADAYSCRNRNRAADGKLSEHAFGRAIDVSGFRLGDGTLVSVRDGWGTGFWDPVLRRIHDAGCGPFATVLGPAANALHADHLHLDVESRRSGPYCR
ncbi:MAG: extensin family protein [Amaricoccus sp.]